MIQRLNCPTTRYFSSSRKQRRKSRRSKLLFYRKLG
jgi:hypothetical protein